MQYAQESPNPFFLFCPLNGLSVALSSGSYSYTTALLTIGNNAILQQGTYNSFIAATLTGDITVVLG